MVVEIGLAIGCECGLYQDIEREWLYWHDEAGQRLPTPDERSEQERQRAEQAENRLKILLEQLQQYGIDPDCL